MLKQVTIAAESRETREIIATYPPGLGSRVELSAETHHDLFDAAARAVKGRTVISVTILFADEEGKED